MGIGVALSTVGARAPRAPGRGAAAGRGSAKAQSKDEARFLLYKFLCLYSLFFFLNCMYQSRTRRSLFLSLNSLLSLCPVLGVRLRGFVFVVRRGTVGDTRASGGRGHAALCRDCLSLSRLSAPAAMLGVPGSR